MASFSLTSKGRLATCHPKLIQVMERVILVRDITIIQGHRTPEQHETYLAAGKTKVEYEQSKHSKQPSLAVDIAPWFKKRPHIRWNDWKSWYVLGGAVIGIAWNMGIPIRWGGDWDRDWQFGDQTFHDLPHFELMHD
ncbi:MAG: M15 family metallopeptidase [Desulfobacteraceae bacterium]|jgi:peptidoglycan L-alanyl-D-glutamate endopeptidase CwlK